jgi:hypothetical protein
VGGTGRETAVKTGDDDTIGPAPSLTAETCNGTAVGATASAADAVAEDTAMPQADAARSCGEALTPRGSVGNCDSCDSSIAGTADRSADIGAARGDFRGLRFVLAVTGTVGTVAVVVVASTVGAVAAVAVTVAVTAVVVVEEEILVVAVAAAATAAAVAEVAAAAVVAGFVDDAGTKLGESEGNSTDGSVTLDSGRLLIGVTARMNEGSDGDSSSLGGVNDPTLPQFSGDVSCSVGFEENGIAVTCAGGPRAPAPCDTWSAREPMDVANGCAVDGTGPTPPGTDVKGTPFSSASVNDTSRSGDTGLDVVDQNEHTTHRSP